MTAEALERIGLTVDYSPSTSDGYKRTINAINTRMRRIWAEMKVVRTLLSNQEKMDAELLEKFQDLNEQLRLCGIFRTEFIYSRNML
jgi:hypothetical protein